MRKIIAAVLALVLILTLIAPVAMASTVPTIKDDTAEVLASTQTSLFIAIGAIAVLAIGVIVLIIIKKKALQIEQKY